MIGRRPAARAAGRLVVVGCGGVSSAEDAYRKIRAGASLVQVYTGLIYGGPAFVRRVNEGLLALLARDGFSTVAEAVGADLRKERGGARSGARPGEAGPVRAGGHPGGSRGM